MVGCEIPYISICLYIYISICLYIDILNIILHRNFVLNEYEQTIMEKITEPGANVFWPLVWKSEDLPPHKVQGRPYFLAKFSVIKKLSTLPRREKAWAEPNAKVSSLSLNQYEVIRICNTARKWKAPILITGRRLGIEIGTWWMLPDNMTAPSEKCTTKGISEQRACIQRPLILDL